ncbi:MAG: DEAD/DEAH box helicase [Candidatus Sifarchaeia archaeon]|jgi:ATP-dependent RNA helicase DeaD
MKFSDLNIEQKIVEALSIYGLEEPTEIQREAIPLIKQGFDVIGQSKTGSGKTAAFAVPILEKINEKLTRPQVLVLSPTRELAQQIAEEFVKFSRFMRVNTVCIYGGVSLEPQIKKLRKAHIVVGTPGRTLDHIRRETLDLRNVKIFCLDEIDRMLDMGFIEDVETAIRALPEEKQMLFFGATLSNDILRLANRFSKNLEFVQTETHVSDNLLKQFYYELDFRQKFSLLAHILKKKGTEKAIVFCNTRREVDLITKNLRNNGLSGKVSALHGGLSQARRNSVIRDFHAGRFKVLVATDVAGRGLDIDDVSHIVNYDIPQNPEDYINRIGRTARAGAEGKAISLLSERDFDAFQRIMIHDLPIEKLEVPNIKRLRFERDSYNKRPRKRKAPRTRDENKIYSSHCL